jgi:hypothetical protein
MNGGYPQAKWAAGSAGASFNERRAVMISQVSTVPVHGISIKNIAVAEEKIVDAGLKAQDP